MIVFVRILRFSLFTVKTKQFKDSLQCKRVKSTCTDNATIRSSFFSCIPSCLQLPTCNPEKRLHRNLKKNKEL